MLKMLVGARLKHDLYLSWRTLWSTRLHPALERKNHWDMCHTQYLLPEILSYRTSFSNKIAIVSLPIPLKSVINWRPILKFIEIFCCLWFNCLHLSTAKMSLSLNFILHGYSSFYHRWHFTSFFEKLISLLNGSVVESHLCSVWANLNLHRDSQGSTYRPHCRGDLSQHYSDISHLFLWHFLPSHVRTGLWDANTDLQKALLQIQQTSNVFAE